MDVESRSFDDSDDDEELDLSQTEWIAALSFAHEWGFADVKERTLQKLSKLVTDAVIKMELVQRYQITKWKSPCLRSLITREEPFTLNEARRLKETFAMKIAELREEYMRLAAFPSGYKHEPPPPAFFQSYQICQKPEVKSEDIETLKNIGDSVIEEQIEKEFALERKWDERDSPINSIVGSKPDSVLEMRRLLKDDARRMHASSQNVTESGASSSLDAHALKFGRAVIFLVLYKWLSFRLS